jgi:hypothetical protein
MSIIKTSLAALAVAFALSTSAIAQTATAPSTAPVKPAAPVTAPAATTAKPATASKKFQPKTEVSKKCSADADAKKLHGKERKTFRATCMKAAPKN